MEKMYISAILRYVGSTCLFVLKIIIKAQVKGFVINEFWLEAYKTNKMLQTEQDKNVLFPLGMRK